MLLYLNGSTWTREDCSLRLSAEVAKAMAAGIPLVLAHEMPDVREHSKAGSRSADRRNGCPFHMFIEYCSNNTVPQPTATKIHYIRIS